MRELAPGWTLSKVGGLFDMQLGKMLSKEASAGPEQRRYLTNKNVQWNRIDFEALNYMSFSSAEREKFRLVPGDLLVTEGGEVGRTAMWEEEREECYFQKSLHRLRSRGQIEPRYMLHYMSYAARWQMFTDSVGQTSIAHLPQDKFAEHFVAHPVDLAEQRRIVEVIDSLAELEHGIEASIAKFEALRLGVMQELAELECGKLDEVLKLGPQNGIYKPASSYGLQGTPIVRIDSFSRGESDLTRGLLRVAVSGREVARYGLSVGDIVINRVNTPDLVGKSTSVRGLIEPTIFESNMMRCKLHRSLADPVFTETWLGSSTVKRYFLGRAKSAISQASINGDDVRNCPFPKMNVAEQLAFLERLEAVEDQRLAEAAEHAKLRQLKLGLVDDLLSGRVAPSAVAA
ncbi:restriction endonuclease subunit S [Streptomyces sp. MBT97]|uniref:restriction endonuclease subunit S n=1 Tax=Streptomyces sp. MBT97 TaxID=2800411 RepID=UPI00190AFEC4|nr:restriction endonuclease subunit S [Streptomyces sp. MBT97]MBK3633651.1 restriction endonuclease subunit S [Streptomyces sp. MBT97]